jgi:hypothetical protein
MDSARIDMIVSQLNASFFSSLQAVGRALANDGKIDISEGGMIAAQMALTAFGFERLVRGLSSDDWGEVIDRWAEKAGMT